MLQGVVESRVVIKNKENFVFKSSTDWCLAHGLFFRERDNNDEVSNGPLFLSFCRKGLKL